MHHLSLLVLNPWHYLFSLSRVSPTRNDAHIVAERSLIELNHPSGGEVGVRFLMGLSVGTTSFNLEALSEIIIALGFILR
jgi:hypothetical protein